MLKSVVSIPYQRELAVHLSFHQLKLVGLHVNFLRESRMNPFFGPDDPKIARMKKYNQHQSIVQIRQPTETQSSVENSATIGSPSTSAEMSPVGVSDSTRHSGRFSTEVSVLSPSFRHRGDWLCALWWDRSMQHERFPGFICRRRQW
jgi:hypothetical protein